MELDVLNQGLLSPLTLGDIELRNRIVISPLQEYAANPDGLALDFHLVHLGRFALGGAGLVFTEALAVSPEARLTYADLGIWEDRQIEPLRRIASFLREHGAVPGAQLLHAGRKGSVQRPWHGYEPLGDADFDERGERAWQTVGPSAVPAMDGWPAPKALTVDECGQIVQDHAVAARRCREAGFEALNIHGAHGYLIHSFLSPLSNTRDDIYGGSLEGRMRLAIEIAEAVRTEWPKHLPIFYRLSCVDDLDGGWSLDDTLVLAERLKAAGVDVIDCSSRGLGRRGTPVVFPRAPGFQVGYANTVRRDVDIPTCAVGLIYDFDEANTIIKTGQADLVAIGREALRNPNWPAQAAVALEGEDAYDTHWPARWGWWLVRRARSLQAFFSSKG
jgi:2,4-dienoyl-CoA reductase-like NADH-dependent reductase (Old Yellow Enzyme family)